MMILKIINFVVMMKSLTNCRPFILFFLSQIIGLWVNSQSDTIGIIDFYGTGNFNINDLRNKIAVKEGDAVVQIEQEVIIKNLKTIPGVKQTHLTTVCCDEKGRSVLFVGVSDKDALPNPYNKTPTSTIDLPRELVEASEKFNELMIEGIMKGESGEDRSQGHSLMNYGPAKAIQEKFTGYAEKYSVLLKNVLKNSSDADQRAVAAQLLAYAKDKNSIVDDLLYAVHDADDGVRNNSTRALALIASYSANNPALKIKNIPVEPFTKMMNSIVWTDRNKGSAVLLSLTEKKEEAIIKEIKEQALFSICQMANWKNPGHAMMGYLLLGRITGYSDEEIYKAFDSENRNVFLITMLIKVIPH
jgi:hypothetical protein